MIGNYRFRPKFRYRPFLKLSVSADISAQAPTEISVLLCQFWLIFQLIFWLKFKWRAKLKTFTTENVSSFGIGFSIGFGIGFGIGMKHLSVSVEFLPIPKWLKFRYRPKYLFQSFTTNNAIFNLKGGSIGDCASDTFAVSSSGNKASPVICGVNTGQHSKLK